MKAFLKKNKALLLLPLVLLPFIVLIFYILEGGENVKTEQSVSENNQQGINYSLPEAEKSIIIFDKMEAYKRQENMAAMPDYTIQEYPDSLTEDSVATNSDKSEEEPSGTLAPEVPESPGDLLSHIRQKEVSIRKEMAGSKQQQEITDLKSTGKIHFSESHKEGINKKEEKITPEKPQTRLTGIAELDKVFDENLMLKRENDSLQFYLRQVSTRLDEIETEKNKRFTICRKEASAFGKNVEHENPLIRAEIYETATVLDGNRVKLRLLEDAWINGVEIPVNSFIYGICKISNERLLIQITQLPVRENFFPVNLAIYDLDGLRGLYVPGNAARHAVKEVGGSTNTSSLFGVADNPLAYAGIRAADRTAQTLLKNVRLKRVTVKKNTLVYLINQKQ